MKNIKFNQITKDMEEEFEIIALVSQCVLRPTKSGKDYLDLELTTKEGIMKAKKWGPLTQEDKSLKTGKVVEATAKVNVYQGQISLILSEMKTVSIDPNEFKLTVIEPVDELIDEFYSYVKMIKNPQLKAVLEDLFSQDKIKNNFFIHPAAKSCHHAEENGLLYHTTRMLRAANALCDCFNKQKQVVNKDLVLTGIIFHDIGKIDEMMKTPAGNGEYTKYSLIGHIVLGAFLINEYHTKGMLDDEIAFQLEHIVLAHHGKLEFGSPVLPATPEAIMVSKVDGLDAKIFACQNDMLRLQPGELAADSDYGLDGAHTYYPPQI